MAIVDLCYGSVSRIACSVSHPCRSRPARGSGVEPLFGRPPAAQDKRALSLITLSGICIASRAVSRARRDSSARRLADVFAGITPTLASRLTLDVTQRRPLGQQFAARQHSSEEDFPTGWEEFRYVAGAVGQTSGLNAKVVYFIRHAESMSNAAAKVFPKNDPRRKAVYEDGQYFDAPLSWHGIQTCRALFPPPVGLVACSPLTRALQTAHEVFGFGTLGTFKRPPSSRLMVLEALREFNSSVFHPCDARRRREELEAMFQTADFGGVGEGGDMLLAPGILETPEICDNRIHWTLAWLRMRPEKRIACVTHSAFLKRLFSEHLVPNGWIGPLRAENLQVIEVPLTFLD